MTGSISQTNALSSFLALEKNRDRYLTQFKNSASIKKDVAYFQKKAAEVKTVDDFVNDPKLLDRKSTRLNSSHVSESRMPSSA